MATKIWLRAEEKAFERRTPLVPADAGKLIEAGYDLVVEDSDLRAFPLTDYQAAGCQPASGGSWKTAPDDAIILGLKELDPDGTVKLRHRHIHFAHIFKGQPGAEQMLKRFKSDGGELFDLECLVDETGRRIAAFGHWAGYAGAALAVRCWAGQQAGRVPPLEPVSSYDSRQDLLTELSDEILALPKPSALVIGALGRSGKGAVELFDDLGLTSTKWDMEETKDGGPFKEVLQHDLFVNCVLLAPGCPPFVTKPDITSDERRLSVIADVSCDPGSPHNPIPIYEDTTTFDAPSTRLVDGPAPLDIIAIDHLPSMLPLESSEDYSSQLLPALMALDKLEEGVWARALNEFKKHTASV